MLNSTQQFEQFRIENDEYHASISFVVSGAFNSYVYKIYNKTTEVEEQLAFSSNAIAQQKLDDRILEIAAGREVVYHS